MVREKTIRKGDDLDAAVAAFIDGGGQIETCKTGRAGDDESLYGERGLNKAVNRIGRHVRRGDQDVIVAVEGVLSRES